jgi:hypothetical protein
MRPIESYRTDSTAMDMSVNEWVKVPTRRELRAAELVEIITAQRKDEKTGKFV